MIQFTFWFETSNGFEHGLTEARSNKIPARAFLDAMDDYFTRSEQEMIPIVLRSVKNAPFHYFITEHNNNLNLKKRIWDMCIEKDFIPKECKKFEDVYKENIDIWIHKIEINYLLYKSLF